MDENSVRVDGLDLHYRIRGEGEPLLLLHGYTGCGADWDHVFPEPPDGFQLIAPDLRGHGSSLNPSGRFTFRQCAADLVGLLDHLSTGPVSAIGLSGGGQALLHIATSEPSRIRSQVLASTAPYFPNEARKLMEQVRPDAMGDAEWQAMRARHTGGDEQILALWKHGREFRDSYEDVNFTPPLLGRIGSPTLIVHGDRDPFYPVDVAVAMYLAIPKSWLWILPGAGHAPIFGSYAPQFRRSALSFLAGRDA